MAQAQLREESRRRERLEAELAALQTAHAAVLGEAEGAAAAATAQAAQAASTAERLQTELGEAHSAVKVCPTDSTLIVSDGASDVQTPWRLLSRPQRSECEP